jgi:hypothetical protein
VYLSKWWRTPEYAREMANLAKHAYPAHAHKGQLSDPWEEVEESERRDDGFHWVLFKNRITGQYVLAFAGTDEPVDWVHNFVQGYGLGQLSSQYAEATRIAGEFKAKYGELLALTGHSLGGGLAAAAGMNNGIPTITFNAAAVNQASLHPGLALDRQRKFVMEYRVRGEALTQFQAVSRVIDAASRAGFSALGYPVPMTVLPVNSDEYIPLTGDSFNSIELHGLDHVFIGLNRLISEGAHP